MFAFMNFDGVFGRSDIMEITSISITAAGNLLNILKNDRSARNTAMYLR